MTVRQAHQPPCAGCSKKVETAYTGPDDRCHGNYTLLPQCPACAAKLVAGQLPVTLNPSFLGAEFSVEEPTAAIPPHEVVRMQDAGHEVVCRDGMLIVVEHRFRSLDAKATV